MKTLLFILLATSISVTGEIKTFFKLKSDAERGSQKAQYELGLMCLEGRGIQKNSQLAVYWLSKSVAQGEVNKTIYSNSVVLLNRAKASNEIAGAKMQAEQAKVISSAPKHEGTLPVLYPRLMTSQEMESELTEREFRLRQAQLFLQAQEIDLRRHEAEIRAQPTPSVVVAPTINNQVIIEQNSIEQRRIANELRDLNFQLRTRQYSR